MRKLLAFSTVLLLLACSDNNGNNDTSEPSEPNDNTIYFDNAQWMKTEAKNFEISIDAENNPHHMTLLLKKNSTYPHPLLLLTVEETKPSGEVLSYDFELDMRLSEDDVDEIAVRGSKGFLVIPSIEFSESGDYNFAIRHSMPEATLPGLENLGLIISPL